MLNSTSNPYLIGCQMWICTETKANKAHWSQSHPQAKWTVPPQHGSWVRRSLKMIIEESPRWLPLRRKHSQCYTTSCCDSVSDLGRDNTHATYTHASREEEEGTAKVTIFLYQNLRFCGFPAILQDWETVESCWSWMKKPWRRLTVKANQGFSKQYENVDWL